MSHITVLLHETINELDIKEGDIVVDGTLGGGGHSEEIVKRYGDSVTLIGIDLDADAEERFLNRTAALPKNFIFAKDNFRNIDKVLKANGLEYADKILLDLGLSSFQLDISDRGFSFKREGNLKMTFSKDSEGHVFDARDIVNEWEEESIADIIFGYGDERYSRRIAKAIVQARIEKKITNPEVLADIIKRSVPFMYQNGKIHPATKTFQALRIAVNDELGALREVLQKGLDLLNPKGRMAVISFHSLEDRIVKQFFKEKAAEKYFTIINKKPLIPADQEVNENPRSRSAKLRIIQKNEKN